MIVSCSAEIELPQTQLLWPHIYSRGVSWLPLHYTERLVSVPVSCLRMIKQHGRTALGLLSLICLFLIWP